MNFADDCLLQNYWHCLLLLFAVSLSDWRIVTHIHACSDLRISSLLLLLWLVCLAINERVTPFLFLSVRQSVSLFFTPDCMLLTRTVEKQLLTSDSTSRSTIISKQHVLQSDRAIRRLQMPLLRACSWSVREIRPSWGRGEDGAGGICLFEALDESAIWPVVVVVVGHDMNAFDGWWNINEALDAHCCCRCWYVLTFRYP